RARALRSSSRMAASFSSFCWRAALRLSRRRETRGGGFVGSGMMEGRRTEEGGGRRRYQGLRVVGGIAKSTGGLHVGAGGSGPKDPRARGTAARRDAPAILCRPRCTSGLDRLDRRRQDRNSS